MDSLGLSASSVWREKVGKPRRTELKGSLPDSQVLVRPYHFRCEIATEMWPATLTHAAWCGLEKMAFSITFC